MSKPSLSGGTAANALWGGRFDGAPDAVMQAINASIDVDQRLWWCDIAGSRAHAAMLAACDVISRQDADAIARGLDQVEAELSEGRLAFDPALEDIHMHIEARLKEIIGAPAGRLHTARSRNDQVATDFRMWVRDALRDADTRLAGLQSALVDQADAHADAVMPGFTHLQTAQPITFGHHCLAYVEMFARDRGRLTDCLRRLNESPLGAAALAGTPYPIDRAMTASQLGFDAPMANSLDAVSSRDFALEALAALTICATHVSRLAEEIVLWTSPHFAFVSLSDRFSTGSSIMPQKRNPDAAELARAKVGRIAAAFQQLVMVMKALPLAYAKDLQEDKQVTFEAFDSFTLAVAAMTGMIGDLRVHRQAMAKAAGFGHATATDLADWLVTHAGVAFRDAHHIVGALVAEADARGCGLHELELSVMQEAAPMISAQAAEALTPQASVASRTSYGGAAPARVREQVARWRALLEKETS